MPIAGTIDPTAPAGEVVARILGGIRAPEGAKLSVPLILKSEITGDADVHGIQNPSDSDCLVAAVVSVVTVDASETLDVGVAANGATSGDGLIDGLSVATAGVFSSIENKGTNGHAFALLNKKGGANDYLVWQASAGTDDLAGQIVFILLPINE